MFWSYANRILQRLENFTNGSIKYDDEDKKPKAFYGAIYGLRIDSLSEVPVLLNCSGKTIFAGNEDDEKTNIEFLSEIMPVGLDPVGVLYLTADEEEEEDHDHVAHLLTQLPVRT